MIYWIIANIVIYFFVNIVFAAMFYCDQQQSKTKQEYQSNIIATITIFLFGFIIVICSIPVCLFIAIKKEYQAYKILPEGEGDSSETMSKSREACHKLDMGV